MTPILDSIRNTTAIDSVLEIVKPYADQATAIAGEWLNRSIEVMSTEGLGEVAAGALSGLVATVAGLKMFKAAFVSQDKDSLAPSRVQVPLAKSASPAKIATPVKSATPAKNATPVRLSTPVQDSTVQEAQSAGDVSDDDASPAVASKTWGQTAHKVGAFFFKITSASLVIGSGIVTMMDAYVRAQNLFNKA